MFLEYFFIMLILLQIKLDVPNLTSRAENAESDVRSRAEIYAVNNILREMEQEAFRRFLQERQTSITISGDNIYESDSENSCIDVSSKGDVKTKAKLTSGRIRSKSVDGSKRLKQTERFGGV